MRLSAGSVRRRAPTREADPRVLGGTFGIRFCSGRKRCAGGAPSWPRRCPGESARRKRGRREKEITSAMKSSSSRLRSVSGRPSGEAPERTSRSACTGVSRASSRMRLSAACGPSLSIEPVVHGEEQVFEAAFRHQHLDAHRERMVVGPLLRRASPVQVASLAARMFMICSGACLEQALSHQETGSVCGMLSGRRRRAPGRASPRSR